MLVQRLPEMLFTALDRSLQAPPAPKAIEESLVIDGTAMLANTSRDGDAAHHK